MPVTLGDFVRCLPAVCAADPLSRSLRRAGALVPTYRTLSYYSFSSGKDPVRTSTVNAEGVCRNIAKATEQYESWLATYTTIVQKDLNRKHEAMTQSPFAFLRATFYRWAQRWPKVCPDLAAAPPVLGVGDLHVENFGTWRDSEGRLIWGVNDFDEASTIAYTNDLTRLATSAHLACQEKQLRVALGDACEAILEGYARHLERKGEPFVLDDRHVKLRAMAQSDLRAPGPFWEKLHGLPTLKKGIPASAIEALEPMLPEVGLRYRVAHRVAGLGSLGHERYVALAEWRGGHVAREAKALVPSACLWAGQVNGPVEILYQAITNRAVRCPDPTLQVQGQWIVRRLAPDCSAIELASLPTKRDELHLLTAMGAESANVHLGSPDALAAVRRDLKSRKPTWLRVAAEAMAGTLLRDWEAWIWAIAA